MCLSYRYFSPLKTLIVWIITAFLVSACSPRSNQQNKTMDTPSQILAQQLEFLGYHKLFLAGSQEKAPEVWQKGANKALLLEVINSPSSTPYSKFLAAEIFHYSNEALPEATHKPLARAYAYTLAHTSTRKKNSLPLNGNAWGLLYEEDDPGQVGKHFMSLGKATIPSLVELLEDSDGEVLYEGSEEALLGSGYQYRIKDFAAFYLSKITGIPITFYQNIKKRDAEIERFKRAIGKK